MKETVTRIKRPLHPDEDRRLKVSIVIPVYNEEAVLDELWERLMRAADAWGMVSEFLFVDDGSQDTTPRLLQDLCERDSRCRHLRLSRNFGHQAALSAGLERTRGNAVVTMDGDLQDPPEVIDQLLQAWRDGADVVLAVRRKRKEAATLRSAYWLFYRLLAKLSSVEIPLDVGDFCLLDRRVVDALTREFPERDRFHRGLRAYAGFTQKAVPYDRDARAAGVSKYGLYALLRLALSGLTGFSLVPLRLSALLGLAVSLGSFGAGLFLVAQHLFGLTAWGRSGAQIPMLTYLALGVFLLFGVTLITLGILGEYVGRIYLEVKRRPAFVVEYDSKEERDVAAILHAHSGAL